MSAQELVNTLTFPVIRIAKDCVLRTVVRYVAEIITALGAFVDCIKHPITSDSTSVGHLSILAGSI